MVDFSWQGRAALGSLLDIQGVNYQYNVRTSRRQLLTPMSCNP